MIQEERSMSPIRLILGLTAFLFAIAVGTGTAVVQNSPDRVMRPYPNFQLEVLVNGRPLAEYYARGRTYVEALQGAEYELRVRNPSPDRIAVALSVDGLNTVDARHTSAWNASKWVIEPYQTITISGWQMSSERARRFYFTNERDSYGAKTPPYPIYRDDRESKQSARTQEAPQSKGESTRQNRAIAPVPDDEYAATGIGRSVRHDVRWVDMDLDSRAAAEVTIRYEYYSALLRLGIVPRQSREPYPLQRREDSRGFSPEP
jgi:hypothetical protein